MPSSLSSPAIQPQPEHVPTIPLFFQLSNGTVEQIPVTSNDTIESIAATLGEKISPDTRFTFANSDLDPCATLQDANIVEAYTHACSLLYLIDSSAADVETKSAALESACAVVKKVSHGVKSMSALTAAAASEDTPAHDSAETAENAVTPQQLAESLSVRLPHFFAPEDSSFLESPPPPQPSITSIREARRAIRSNSVPRDEQVEQNPPDDQFIGQSTISPISRPPVTPKQLSRNVVLSNSGKTTWMDDVKTTWSVGAARQSGVLSSSKLGLELDQYFRQLELPEEEEQPSPDQHASQSELIPGESSEEEGTTNSIQEDMLNVSSPNPTSSSPNPTSSFQQHPMSTVRPDLHRFPFSALLQPTSSPHDAPTSAGQPGRSACGQLQSIPSQSDTQTGSLAFSNRFDSADSVESSSGNTTSLHSGAPLIINSYGFPKHSQSRTRGHQRQATKIAPALSPPESSSELNGFLGIPALPFQGEICGPSSVAVRTKNKRGRKRKKPELTDEERLLWRKQQNRESAKLSRVRRKVIAAEYEVKLNALFSENSQLKKQIDGLNNSLAYLQSLLTVSVSHEPNGPS